MAWGNRDGERGPRGGRAVPEGVHVDYPLKKLNSLAGLDMRVS